MNSKNVLTVVAAAAFGVFAQSAIAQPTTAPSRAEVKSDTASAAKAGTLTPPGQGPGAMTSSQAGTMPGVATKPAGTATATGPTTTMAPGAAAERADRKADAKAATGTSDTKAGQHPLPQNAKEKEKMSSSATTRAERKEDARKATKEGKIPVGEAPRPIAEPQKK